MKDIHNGERKMNVIEFKRRYDKAWEKVEHLFNNPSDYTDLKEVQKIIDDFVVFCELEVILKVKGK